MNVEDCSQKYCIIGGGPSGLTVAKNFKQRGIPFDCFEREDDVGGNWYYGRACSSVYASTHLISSKRLTEYTDFRMSSEVPSYPSHQQALEYLRSYARHHVLYEDIRFHTAVVRVEPEGSGWRVTLDDQTSRLYRGVVIANGHHWDPLVPELPGSFLGQSLHSHDYKTPDILRGKRVLVIGAGNSGCDIAVESAQTAADTMLSMRRGYHFLPKFLCGMPVDRCEERLRRWFVPLWLRRIIAWLFLRTFVGKSQHYGLPIPDHKLFESHPIINSLIPYYVAHRRIRIKPNIEQLSGDRVRFADGSEDAVDCIIYATGFHISFPFIDREHLHWQDGAPGLYLNVFHPQYDNLFIAGMIQPNGGQWKLTDYQAQLIGNYIVSLTRDPAGAAWFQRLKSKPSPDLSHGIRYLDSPRHRLEVEYFSYRDRLRKLLTRFDDVSLERPPEAGQPPIHRRTRRPAGDLASTITKP